MPPCLDPDCYDLKAAWEAPTISLPSPPRTIVEPGLTFYPDVVALLLWTTVPRVRPPGLALCFYLLELIECKFELELEGLRRALELGVAPSATLALLFPPSYS